MDLRTDITEEYQNVYIIEQANITNKKSLNVFDDTRELHKSQSVKFNPLNIRFSSKTFSYLNINSDFVNIQENISFFYAPYILNPKSFLRLTRIFTIIFSLEEMPHFGKVHLHFSYIESNKQFSLILKNIDNKLLFKRKYSYKQREDCIKDLKGIFLNQEELELFSVKKFTDLKDGWFEYLELIRY